MFIYVHLLCASTASTAPYFLFSVTTLKVNPPNTSGLQMHADWYERERVTTIVKQEGCCPGFTTQTQ